MIKVDFEVVELYYKDGYTGYSLKKPKGEIETISYGIKIGNDVFLIGDKGNGIWFSDSPSED